MKYQGWLIGLLLVGCGDTGTHASVQDAKRSGPEASSTDVDVALADVPAEVKQAALDALPGFVLTKAEKETEDGVTFYSLTGTVDGQTREIEITPDGKVRKIESKAEDDDDGEHEDDEEDEKG